MTLQEPFSFFFQRKLIADLALKHKLPFAMSEAPAGDAGVLLQVNPDARVRRALGHLCRSYPEITTQFNATLKVDGIRPLNSHRRNAKLVTNARCRRTPTVGILFRNVI
jgi:hypothetical protein